jgi:hypothetical protein
VYCDAPSSKIVDAKHAAYDISPQIVKHQDFPYWISVFVQDWGGLRDKSVGGGALMGGIGGLGRLVVEVEDLLDCSWISVNECTTWKEAARGKAAYRLGDLATFGVGKPL